MPGSVQGALGLGRWTGLAAILVALAACGASMTSPFSHPQPSTARAPSSAQLVDVAKEVYGVSPEGTGTCALESANGPHPFDHFRSCPLTDQLRARYAAEAPDGFLHSGPSCQASCSVPLLCLCQFRWTYVNYVAVATATGGRVSVAQRDPANLTLGGGDVFILEMTSGDGQLKVDDIKVIVGHCPPAELDQQPPC
jgi:hypothetical protein